MVTVSRLKISNMRAVNAYDEAVMFVAVDTVQSEPKPKYNSNVGSRSRPDVLSWQA